MSWAPAGLVGVSFLVAAAVTWLATPSVARMARRAGAMDHPRGRRIHAKPTPTWGGIAIYLGFLASVGWLVWLGQRWSGARAYMGDTQLAGILVGGTGIALLGAIDDRFDLRPIWKLIGQICCAVVLLKFGVRIQMLSNPFGHDSFFWLPAWGGALLTVGWVVAVTNTINFIDGLDGLAAGVSAIASITLATMAIDRGQFGVALLAGGLAGGAVGFLPFNFNPARIFMGDLGSHLLGFTLAALSVQGALKIATGIAVFVPLLVLAVPILDTAFAIVRRLRHRQPIYRADKGHLHHRLLALGLSQRQAVVIIYLVSGLFAGLALLLSRAG